MCTVFAAWNPLVLNLRISKPEAGGRLEREKIFKGEHVEETRQSRLLYKWSVFIADSK